MNRNSFTVRALYRTWVVYVLTSLALVFPASAFAQALPNEGGASGADVRGTETAKAETSSTQGYPTTQQKYPGPYTPKGNVETTMGPLKVRFYGTLLLNFSASDSVQVGQDVPLWPLPGNVPISFADGTTRRAGIVRDTVFTARQSVLGLNFAPAGSTKGGWTPSGVLEIDFFGSRPVDGLQPQGRVLNQPRLRLAYLQLEKDNWKIVAGQDKVIIAPLDPVSLSHVAVPLGATAGNLWGWLPQVRLDATHKFGDYSTLFQVGVLRPLFADPRLGDLPASGTSVDAVSSGLGERANKPFYQARLAVSHAMMGSTATVGAGVHYGRERVGAQRTLESWAFALDYSVPLHSRVTLRGEGFAGSNLVPFQGGVLQGVAFVPPVVTPTGVITTPARFRRIGAGGGWAELTVLATSDSSNIVYLGAGTDDPRDRHLLPGSTRSKNSFTWASYFRKLTDEVTVALEWSFWDFRVRTFTPTGALGPRGTSGRGNVFNVAIAYQF